MNKLETWKAIDNAITIIEPIPTPSDFYQEPEILFKMLRNGSRQLDESYWLWRFTHDELPTFCWVYS